MMMTYRNTQLNCFMIICFSLLTRMILIANSFSLLRLHLNESSLDWCKKELIDFSLFCSLSQSNQSKSHNNNSSIN